MIFLCRVLILWLKVFIWEWVRVIFGCLNMMGLKWFILVFIVCFFRDLILCCFWWCGCIYEFFGCLIYGFCCFVDCVFGFCLFCICRYGRCLCGNCVWVWGWFVLLFLVGKVWWWFWFGCWCVRSVFDCFCWLLLVLFWSVYGIVVCGCVCCVILLLCWESWWVYKWRWFVWWCWWCFWWVIVYLDGWFGCCCVGCCCWLWDVD